MDETSALLRQYENLLGLYKHTNEIRQSRINWGLGIETALIAAVGAFGDELAVALAASAGGMLLAAALFFMLGRHNKHSHLWSAEGREIEMRLEHLSAGELTLTAFRHEETLFAPTRLSFFPWAYAWVRSIRGRPMRSVRFPRRDEPVEVRFSSALSANSVETLVMAFIFFGWLALLVLFATGVVEIGGDRWWVV